MNLKFLGERTNYSENEQIYHPNFVWYVETSSSGDINPMSCHLTAFDITNQLLYMNFPSLERKIFQSTLPSSAAMWFRNLGTGFMETWLYGNLALWKPGFMETRLYNRCVYSFKIPFEVSLQEYSAIITTIRRPRLTLAFKWIFIANTIIIIISVRIPKENLLSWKLRWS